MIREGILIIRQKGLGDNTTKVVIQQDWLQCCSFEDIQVIRYKIFVMLRRRKNVAMQNIVYSFAIASIFHDCSFFSLKK